MSRTDTVGKIGEYVAAIYYRLRGHTDISFCSPGAEHDLTIGLDDGKLATVQVKTSAGQRSGSGEGARWEFRYGLVRSSGEVCRSDWFLLIALFPNGDIRTMQLEGSGIAGLFYVYRRRGYMPFFLEDVERWDLLMRLESVPVELFHTETDPKAVSECGFLFENEILRENGYAL